MKNDCFKTKIGASLLVFTLIAGCSQESDAPAKKAVVAAPATKIFQTSAPASFKSLVAKADGTCYLDAINEVPLVNKSGEFKAGSPVLFAGWAVANMKAVKVGSAVWLELRGDKSFYSEAAFHQRPGLGKALGAEGLDGGGVVLRDIALPSEVGRYEVIYLVQSGNDLVRCNTGNTISIK